jgi:hypothetical protein
MSQLESEVQKMSVEDAVHSQSEIIRKNISAISKVPGLYFQPLTQAARRS